MAVTQLVELFLQGPNVDEFKSPLQLSAIEVSLGKTLKSNVLPVALVVPCMAAAVKCFGHHDGRAKSAILY